MSLLRKVKHVLIVERLFALLMRPLSDKTVPKHRDMFHIFFCVNNLARFMENALQNLFF